MAMTDKLGYTADGTLRDPITDVDERLFPTDELAPDFPPPSFTDYAVVSVDEMREQGYPIEEITYLTIGGGVGSFIFVDNLVLSGVPPQEIASVGMEASPYGRYKRLCEHSQIAPDDRLRSDSGSTPDNIWGWPGYAVREAVTDIGKGDIGHAFRVLGNIASEPDFADSYTPISGRVYASMEREAQRIGWSTMARLGRVLGIRKTDDERYIAAYAARDGDSYTYQFIVGRYLHIAVGYPAVRMLPDLIHYRESEHEMERVVSSYEEHMHVYDYLREHGGSVVVRGRGIVASRVIQRIYNMRQENPNIDIIHLMRNSITAPSSFGGNQRVLEHNWEIQPYNFPKGMWGGNLRHIFADADDDERRRLIGVLGGTTTSDRHDWRGIIEQGVNEGWYQIVYGSVSDILEEDDGRVSLLVRSKGKMMQAAITVDFVIDATGLDATIRGHKLFADLFDTYNLPLNPMHRIYVAPSFEAQVLRNGAGRAYVVGAPTLGSHFAPADSFLGLQYASQVAVEDLRRLGAPLIEPMDFYHSTLQWFRWAFNQAPHKAVKEALA
jgi:pSer/pThr/pTyr-binding forkhead associated (FHA) protein